MNVGLVRVRGGLARWRARLGDGPRAPRTVARVAINMRPAASSWGGGSEWARQTAAFLAARGYSVTFDLRAPVDCILLADPRVGGLVGFGADDVERYRARHPGVYCIHRVNENDARKKTSEMDALLGRANRVADHTVFISAWLRDYHAQRWFDPARPHSVITNGADARFYHPIGSATLAPGDTLRLVTHHWSDNWNKGFDVYQEIDRLVASGALPRTDLWVIGRWPAGITWRAARAFPPAHGEPLARLLRQCHVYVTASRAEPGGMHFIEGIQCGLPVIYHEDGGGIVEVARGFGFGFRDDVGAAVERMRANYAERRAAVLDDPPSGDAMCLAYARLVQRGVTLARSGA